jgi:hypothetical protein
LWTRTRATDSGVVSGVPENEIASSFLFGMVCAFLPVWACGLSL